MQQLIHENSPEHQRELISLVSKESCDEIELRCTPASQLSLENLREMNSLFKTDYCDWKPEDLFEKYAAYHTRHVYRLFSNDVLIGTRQICISENDDSTHPWTLDITDIAGKEKFAVGSRTIVHPDYRNSGIGTFLINNINNDLFKNHNVKIIFGSSTSIGAISLYMRLGAKIWVKDIDKLPYRNNSQQKIEIIEQLLKTKELRHMRLKQPIRYIYHQYSLPYIHETLTWSNQPPGMQVTTRL